MTAIKLLADGTIRAAGLILLDKGIKIKDIDCEALTVAIKATLKTAIPDVLKEWEDATNAHLSDAWLRELMNAQANELAIKSLKSLGWL